MQQSRIRKILSYLYDIPIESLRSDHNESLDLVLSKGRYQLLTQGAIYSYEDKYDNYKQSFHQYNLDNYSIDNVLLLGMGMASIPVILERIFDKRYNYTGVEIDEEVIYLASKYIIDDLDSSVDIVQADANIYMQLNTSPYDMICMDVFIDDKIPDKFHKEDFLIKLRDGLNPQGLVFFNWLAVSEEDIRTVDKYFESVFKKVFPDGKKLVLASNRMLVNR